MTGSVLVVGGGPAGLALAIGARRAGLAVTVIDSRRPPVDKACGEGLMPEGVEALAALGVDVTALGRPFHGIRYLDATPAQPTPRRDGADGAAEPPVAEARFPGAPGIGVRRTRLHAALVQAAEAAGAELRWGLPARGLQRLDELGSGAPGDRSSDPRDREQAHAGARSGGAGRPGERFAVRTDAGLLRADWIVAADGLTSRLRRWAGLDGTPPRRPRFGVRRHYRIAPWALRVEVWWGDGCEAYVTPVGGEEVGVAMLWNGGSRGLGKVGFDDLLPRFPALAGQLAGAQSVSADRGAGPLARRPRALSRGNLVLVGDAAGYLDAITGEGLSLAFRQAAALVPALAAGDLASYERAHRRIARHPERLIRVLLAIERRPRLRRRVLRALAGDPDLFARLLAVHAHGLPLTALGLGGASRLVRALARPGPASLLLL